MLEILRTQDKCMAKHVPEGYIQNSTQQRMRCDSTISYIKCPRNSVLFAVIITQKLNDAMFSI